MTNQNKPLHINDLASIMERLLSPDGCPWDLEQTPKTLTPFAIEEAHELAEAVERNDIEATKEELGDLLMQVIFQAALAQRKGQFTLEDVIEGICTKLIRRHPHVFGNAKVKDSNEVLKNWGEIKKKEKENKKKEDKVFNIPLSLPSLQRAQKIGEKTKSLNFDWHSAEEVFVKVEEEFHELKAAFKSGNKNHMEEELGDTFFVLAQLARHLKLEAETVARGGNRKFEDRFHKLLQRAASKNLDFNTLTNSEKEVLWEDIKEIE